MCATRRPTSSGRPTAKPIRDESATYVARHGFGYSRFQHASGGLALELLEYVAADDPIRISRLTIRNVSSRGGACPSRRTSNGSLGASREATAPFILTEPRRGDRRAVGVQPLEPGFRASASPSSTSAAARRSCTGDRREFMGRNGSLALPGALSTCRRPVRPVGAGLDPCGALQTPFELAPGASRRDSVSPRGRGKRPRRVSCAALPRRPTSIRPSRRSPSAGIDAGRGAGENPGPVDGPDAERLAALSDAGCRVWARAGFYQASGAYGFRDQLQDVMALAVASPALAREQLLRAAARQFSEGDVQHWWLPPHGPGVRTRISDDRSGCPTPSRTTSTRGDSRCWTRGSPSSRARRCSRARRRVYFQPAVGAELAASSNTARARSTSASPSGAHGLPLMGTGDWNDGMNRVGAGGQGESVWLGWFLIATLKRLRPRRRSAGRRMRAARAGASTRRPCAGVEREAWDGDWYRRAGSTTARRWGPSPTGVPDRFDRPVLGGALRRGGRRAGRARDGRASIAN